MTLSLSIDRASLPIETPFEIARGRQEHAEVVFVTLESPEHTGYGAAAPAPRYGETADTVETVLERLRPSVEAIDDIHRLDAHRQQLSASIQETPAAHAAIEMALQDLRAKALGVPLYRLWGLDPTQTVQTSYTIGIAAPETMADRAAAAVADGHEVLKIKLGTEEDRAIVAAVREAAPDVRIRVDANEAWTAQEAIRMSRTLAEYDIEFLEQPVPAAHPDALRRVTRRSAVPIAADESCRTVSDIPQIADACDIVNLKLMKCGGLGAARRMIATARAHGLEVMLGCMVESNASIAAAAQLAPLLDYADLDGALLLADDPFAGVPFSDDRVDLQALDRPGTGARPDR